MTLKDKVYKTSDEFVKEYKREGYEDQEAKRLARQDVADIMGNRVDFADNLFKNALKDLD